VGEKSEFIYTGVKNMRMRKKKHRDARIEARAGLLFGHDFKMPAFLEIGCGKGGFICELAGNNPGANFVAVERNPDVIILAMEKAGSLCLANLRFLIIDAANIADYFGPGEIAGIYLNFSDPWHKNYQAHKRLTGKAFLEIYKNILIPGAKIILKTDNQNFFDFSLRSLSAGGFKILNQTRDLYSSEFAEHNVRTEYENKFISEGVKICRAEAAYIK
jgi:tRNA (guanine-N7-)-methyltransferase